MVEANVEDALVPVGLGLGRCGWGGCGRRGSVYCKEVFSKHKCSWETKNLQHPARDTVAHLRCDLRIALLGARRGR